jgi:hypothetical protein
VVQRADTAAPSALDLRCPGAALAADSSGADGGEGSSSGAPAKVLADTLADSCSLRTAGMVLQCWPVHPGNRLHLYLISEAFLDRGCKLFTGVLLGSLMQPLLLPVHLSETVQRVLILCCVLCLQADATASLAGGSMSAASPRVGRAGASPRTAGASPRGSSAAAGPQFGASPFMPIAAAGGQCSHQLLPNLRDSAVYQHSVVLSFTSALIIIDTYTQALGL